MYLEPPSTTPNTIEMDIALPVATTADKAVKAILPFLNELSNGEWWTHLLAAWIKFDNKGPPKVVSLFYILIEYILNLYIIATTK